MADEEKAESGDSVEGRETRVEGAKRRRMADEEKAESGNAEKPKQEGFPAEARRRGGREGVGIWDSGFWIGMAISGSSGIEEAAFAEDSGGQGGGGAGLLFECGVAPDGDVERAAKAAERAVGEVGLAVLAVGIVGDDQQEVEAAVGAGLIARLGAEEPDGLGSVGFRQAGDGEVEGVGGVGHGLCVIWECGGGAALRRRPRVRTAARRPRRVGQRGRRCGAGALARGARASAPEAGAVPGTKGWGVSPTYCRILALARAGVDGAARCG